MILQLPFESSTDQAIRIVADTLDRTHLPSMYFGHFRTDEGTIIDARCRIDNLGSMPVHCRFSVLANQSGINLHEADFVTG